MEFEIFPVNISMKPSKPQVKSRDFRLWRKSATRQGRFVWAEALETFSDPEKTPCCVHVNTRYAIMRVCKRYFGAGQAKMYVFLSGSSGEKVMVRAVASIKLQQNHAGIQIFEVSQLTFLKILVSGHDRVNRVSSQNPYET